MKNHYDARKRIHDGEATIMCHHYKSGAFEFYTKDHGYKLIWHSNDVLPRFSNNTRVEYCHIDGNDKLIITGVYIGTICIPNIYEVLDPSHAIAQDFVQFDQPLTAY